MLLELWTTEALPAYLSTCWTLLSMNLRNCSAFVFSLDAKFQSCTQISIQIFPNLTHPRNFLSHFWLAFVDFLIVQFAYNCLIKKGLKLVVCLKFQIAGMLSKTA
ncbi:MAG: hypothetical protein CVU39_14115 [Chloroflexi bacterium HGW-Chloroflexi-10]|nr:MAG: hypothetical protein CVU39_14115 [Chloroflexi bacterium HGW-Chloroflexi-10]